MPFPSPSSSQILTSSPCTQLPSPFSLFKKKKINSKNKKYTNKRVAMQKFPSKAV